MLISIIIPVFNEETLVSELLLRVANAGLGEGLEKEIVIVDDGSTDGTRVAVDKFVHRHPELRITHIVQEKNRGKGAAVRTGFSRANGEVFIIQDADLEYDPNEIRDVIRPIVAGDFKIVYGSRILREKAMGNAGIMGFVKGKHPHSYLLAYLGGVAITKWTNLVTGSSLTDEPTCYKAFHRSVIDGITIDCDDFSWEPEVTVKLLNEGHAIHEIPVSYHPRKNDEGKKINWKHGVGALLTIWKYRK